MLAVSHSQTRLFPAMMLVAGVVLLLWGQRDVVVALVEKWFPQGGHSDYGHGGLLVLVAAGVAVARFWRDESGFWFRPSVSGAILLCGAVTTGVFADLMGVEVVRMLALLASVMLLPWALLGWRGFARLGAPFGILVFAIPLWSVLNEPLRLLTAQLVGFLMNVSGIPALVEGPNIRVPAGSFHVADNCTGLRQLVVSMPLAVIYSSLNAIKPRWMLLLVVAAALVSIVVNVVRIYIVVLAGALTEMKHYLVTQDHVTPGWVLFALAMLVFFLVVERFAKPVAGSARLLILRESDLVDVQPVSGVRSGLIAFLVLVGITVPVLKSQSVEPSEPSSVDGSLLPESIPGWTRGNPVGGESLTGYFPGADLDSAAVYRQHRAVLLQMAYYAHQREGHEAVGWPNRPFRPELWRQVSWRKIDVPFSHGMVPVREDVVRGSDGTERLVWSWYFIAGRHLSSPWTAKVMGAIGALQGDPSAICIVLTPVGAQSPEEDRALLRAFVSEAAASLSGGTDDTLSGGGMIDA